MTDTVTGIKEAADAWHAHLETCRDCRDATETHTAAPHFGDYVIVSTITLDEE